MWSTAENLYLKWNNEIRAFHLFCAIETRIPVLTCKLMHFPSGLNSFFGNNAESAGEGDSFSEIQRRHQGQIELHSH